MLPADAITRAAIRWLHILRTSSLAQAWSLIRADTRFTDLTQTQYASALEWLETLNLLIKKSNHLELSSVVKVLPQLQANQLFFERILENSTPAWLQDADILIPDASELPQDAANLANTLGLTEQVAFTAVRHVHGRIDLAKRALIGSAGEQALINFLESRWPGSTFHVAQHNDGFGYDITFFHENTEWHLEVKSTTRRGRLIVHLSRHEYEVGLQDPNWRLIVLGLDDQMQIDALATVQHDRLVVRAPKDICAEAKWQSASYQFSSKDLQYGLSFVEALSERSKLYVGPFAANESLFRSRLFEWMPLR